MHINENNDYLKFIQKVFILVFQLNKNEIYNNTYAFDYSSRLC